MQERLAWVTQYYQHLPVTGGWNARPRLCSKAGDTASEFAMQGTDAHSLCEHKLKTALGQKSKDPRSNLQYFDKEMADCSDMYAQYVMEQLMAAKEKCKDPIVLIEQHLDFSKWVPEGFGTGDCVIVSDETLTVIDLKYGVGILVEAEKNLKSVIIGGKGVCCGLSLRTLFFVATVGQVQWWLTFGRQLIDGSSCQL